MKTTKKPEYINNCVFNFKHHYSVEFRNLYNICVANQEDALDVFVEVYKDNGADKLECSFYGVSLFTNLEWCYRFILNYEPTDKLIIQNNNVPYKYNEDTRFIVRFSTTIDFLKMLSLYNLVQINISDSILASADLYTTIKFDNLGIVTQIQYCDSIVDKKIVWDEIDISDIIDINKAVQRTTNQIYRNYIALTGNKLYSHNDVFLVSKDIKELNNNYYLNSQMLKSLKNLRKILVSYIGYEVPMIDDTGKKLNSDNLYIKLDGIILTWNFNDTSEDSVDNLIELLNQNKFVKIMKIYQKEWSKLNILADYSFDSKKSGDITFDTSRSVIIANKDNNTILLMGDCQRNIKFTVELSLLELARKLSGMSEPSLYLDKTGNDNLLVIKGNKMIVIRIADLKINEKDLLYPELLKKLPKINKSNKEKNNVLNKTFDFNNLTQLSELNLTEVDYSGNVVNELFNMDNIVLNNDENKNNNLNKDKENIPNANTIDTNDNIFGDIFKGIDLIPNSDIKNENIYDNIDNIKDKDINAVGFSDKTLDEKDIQNNIENQGNNFELFSDLYSDDDIWG